MRVNRVFRYRLYPTAEQEEALARHLELCRILYNKALWWRQGAYEREGRLVTRKEQLLALKDLKADVPEYRGLPHSAVEDVVWRVDQAYAAFFRRTKRARPGEPFGHPKHHPPGTYRSMRVRRAREFELEHDGQERFGLLRIRSFGLGRKGGEALPVRMHRPLPSLPGVAVRRAEIKREPTGGWYVCFGWDAEIHPPEYAGQRTVALHPGLVHYVSTDAGETVEAPAAFEAHARGLARAERRLARKRRGSRRYEEEKRVVARWHAKIRDVRKNFQHNLSRRIVDEHDRIYVNSYDITGMLADKESRFLNRRLVDAAWGQFLFMLSYKAQDAGKVYVEVDSKDTAQECSRCSETVHKTLAAREHACGHCGLKLPRGVNAARNVRKRAEAEMHTMV